MEIVPELCEPVSGAPDEVAYPDDALAPALEAAPVEPGSTAGVVP